MRINCQLCLTISWLGVLVRTESSTPKSLENSEKQNLRRQYNVENDKAAAESRRRYSFQKDAFDPFVPPDFQMELKKLKIPVAEDLPRRIEISKEESHEDNGHDSEEENLSEQGSQEDSSEGEHGLGDYERHTESDEDGQASEEEERREEEPSSFEDYDSPKNTISYHYDDSGEIPRKKPKKKRPLVDYEVTETIPHDTKTVRPMQKVYPLPPPCPGAPPPTYPPPEAPATMMPPPPKPPKPPTFPPAPTFPPFPKIFSDSPPSILSKDDFLDSYFPTSFMSSSSSSSSSYPKSTFKMSGPARKRPSSRERYSPGRKEPIKIHKKRASPRVILRYHHPTTLVIRKVQHEPPLERVIIRRPIPRPVKEVHIHHHHDTPSQVLHIHKDDDGAELDTAKFKAKVDSQRLASHSQYESATTGPFAEPPPNIRLPERRGG